MPSLVDLLDVAIMLKLREDGRRPFLRIARELGVSEALVRQRVKRLLERGFLEIVGVIKYERVLSELEPVVRSVNGDRVATLESGARIDRIDVSVTGQPGGSRGKGDRAAARKHPRLAPLRGQSNRGPGG
jgi:DNA-binding Lrp family transcriptional regulator